MAAEPHKFNLLVCSACRYPICSGVEIISDRFTSWEKAVYSYQLDLLDLDDVWCYSATNTHDYRFDVTRIKPPPQGRVVYIGTPTDEYTWFPGFDWRMCHCGACGCHLGWGFSKTKPKPLASVEASCRTQRSDDKLDAPQTNVINNTNVIRTQPVRVSTPDTNNRNIDTNNHNIDTTNHNSDTNTVTHDDQTPSETELSTDLNDTTLHDDETHLTVMLEDTTTSTNQYGIDNVDANITSEDAMNEDVDEDDVDDEDDGLLGDIDIHVLCCY
eukprot:m.146928 g.146928  ORF g.146928 m.146928 type:complete len:271 (+) comp30507_c1_seq3:64-876(+)